MSATETVHPLPWAPAGSGWSWEERSALGVHGACDLILRVRTPDAMGPPLPVDLQLALPIILQEQEQCAEVLERLEPDRARRAAMIELLERVLPRLLTYRWLDASEEREFVFAGARPAGLHVLSRVLDTSFKFRLEDLSHFASHGALVVMVLDAFDLTDVLDPTRILYCPAVDSPHPFKFFPVGGHGARNRDVYVKLLSRLLRQTESDEAFRARNFRELARGFQKFGPAAATPQFQEVELRLWRLLSYIAARLRVKAGRLTDTKDPDKARAFIDELHAVHGALDELVHLPSRLAAYYRSHYDLDLGRLYEQALAGLDELAKKIDCELVDRDRSIEAIAELVSEFRRIGSTSPLESLEDQDREILVAYGDVPVPPQAGGWARTYKEAIFTGAARFDVRRFSSAAVDDTSEEDLELDFDLTAPDPEPVAADDEWEDAETLVEDEGRDVDAPDDDEPLESSVEELEPAGESDLGSDEAAAEFSDLVEGLEGEEEGEPAPARPARPAPRPQPKPTPAARTRPAPAKPAGQKSRPAAAQPKPAAPAARKPTPATPHKKASGQAAAQTPSPPATRPASQPGGRGKVTPPAMQRPGTSGAQRRPAPPQKKPEPAPEAANFEDLLREAADEFGD